MPGQKTTFFPKVGKRKWILITGDRNQRTRPREVEDMRRYGVRHFALPGNLGAFAMARLLVDAKNNIRACCRDNEGFVSANVARDGSVRLLRDKQGSLHERKISKVYKNGTLSIVEVAVADEV